jgi:hypothetical protein
MTSIEKLKFAINILSSLVEANYDKADEFKNIQLVAELNWKAIPQAYKFQSSVIASATRTDIYKLNSTIVIDIRDVGLFQIM